MMLVKNTIQSSDDPSRQDRTVRDRLWPPQQLPINELLPTADTAGLEQARTRQPQFFGEDAGLVELTQNICVIRSAEHTILVDTGEPIKRAGAILGWGLASLGIPANQIDLVFLNHRDDDHIGGTVDLQGEPPYPRARHLISRFEYQEHKLDPKRAQGFQKHIKPLEDRGVLKFFDGETEVVPGLTTPPTPGHRSGASSLRVQDGSEAALLLADTVHLPIPGMVEHVGLGWRDGRRYPPPGHRTGGT